MRTNEPVTIRRDDYRPYPWHVRRTRLRFELDPESTLVTSELTLERRDATAHEPLVLNGVDLVLASLQIDGQELDSEHFTLADDTLTIDRLPTSCVLKTVARINPEANTALEGLYRSGGTFCTQCEAEGFRKITWYPDRPDVLSVFDVEIVAPRSLGAVLLSNGNLVDSSDIAGDIQQVHWHDPHPKPAYLFALVAGDLVEIADTFTTSSGRQVALSIYVEAHNAERCGFAMASLIRAMAWDERVYGLEYDLDRYMIVAVDDFNMGAMENKGLNIFNSKFVLADPETATDTDFLWVEAVIAHEYFHNWTGNRITCRDWFQLSLKEGLTVFRDQCFTADHHSPTVKRIDDVRRLRQAQFVEDAGPLSHPIRPDSYIEINNFYTKTIYEKGAEVIRMLHALIGDEAWRRGMDLYVERHDGTAATCEDFVLAMESASGRSLEQFRLWYSLAGTPVVRCEERWDATAGRLQLALSQQCPDTPGQSDKPPMHIPISVGLLDAKGCEVLEGTRLLELVEREQVFEFEGLGAQPSVSLLRGFSAPVRLEQQSDIATLGLRARDDSDGFTRWDTTQTLANLAVSSLLSERLDEGSRAINELFAVMGRVLESKSNDPLLAAELLRLPSLDLLIEECSGHAVLAVDAARRQVVCAIAEAHGDALVDCVREAIAWAEAGSVDPSDDAFGFGGRSTSTRALAAAAMDLLSSLDEQQWVGLAADYYRAGNTMTDRVCALAVLCHSQAPAREECLAAFEASFGDNSLVMDKWFSLQAMSRRDDTLARVTMLATRTDFDASNPNRLRSLVGSFSNGNVTRFHATDGSGHAWLADWVLRTDAINPLTAARLVAPLTRWQRRDASCAESMRCELQRILDSGSLSPDVFEQVSKSLG